MRKQNLQSHQFYRPLLRPLLLGRGKLARHLHHYLNLLNIPHEVWENARDLQNQGLKDKLNRSNLIWILVSHTLQSLRTDPVDSNVCWMHASAANTIPGMLTLHPLMTFGPELYPPQTYEVIPFTHFNEEQSQPSLLFSDFLEVLPNPKKPMPLAERAFYHAACVMMSNFPQILWNAVTQKTEKNLQLSKKDFEPILRQTLENFFTLGESALTGPLVRNDQATQEKNIHALNPDFAQLYRSFVLFYQQTHFKENSNDHRSRLFEV